jgi:nicotinamidase-related amidase
MISLDPRRTALVLIDLQRGIVGMDLEPRPGAEIAEAGRTLAARARAAGALVVQVRVAFAPDFADAPSSLVDQPSTRPRTGLPAGWGDHVDGLVEPGDLVVTKRQWGAFHGTELDLQLRRRGLDTIVLAGIATNAGVESTARAAHDHGYHVVLVEDACAGVSAALHAMAFEHIFPRLARIARLDTLSFEGVHA